MEHTRPTEIISHQVQRLQRWIESSDVKGIVRRLWSDSRSERAPADAPSEGSRTESLRSEVSPASGNEWDDPRISLSDSSPTQAELERLEAGRDSARSVVFLDDNDLENVFEPTVQEESARLHEDSGVSGAPDTIGDELAERMLRSATGEDPDYHH